jgi:hypothetical protein
MVLEARHDSRVAIAEDDFKAFRDAQGVWANDPWDGKEDYYTMSDFQRALSYFGDMAIEVAGP